MDTQDLRQQMLSLEPYDKKKHELDFKALLIERGLDPKLADDLPVYGYVIWHHKIIAAAFLRRIEGGYGLLDGLITNPEFAGVVRHEAIELIVKCLINRAKESNIKRIIAYSKDNSTLTRALGHGFEFMPDTLINLSLGE